MFATDVTIWPSGSLMSPVLFVLFHLTFKSGDGHTDDPCEIDRACGLDEWIINRIQ